VVDIRSGAITQRTDFSREIRALQPVEEQGREGPRCTEKGAVALLSWSLALAGMIYREQGAC
jgi:hypothetical protein